MLKAEINVTENDKIALGNLLKAFNQSEIKLEGAEITVLSLCLNTVKEMHEGIRQSLKLKSDQEQRKNETPVEKVKTNRKKSAKRNTSK